MTSATAHTLQGTVPLRALFPAISGMAHRLAGAVRNMLMVRLSTSADPARLHRMNAYLLRDIGLTRADLASGPMDSFWRD